MKINLCFFAVLAPLVLEVDAAALNGTVFPSCAVRNVPGEGVVCYWRMCTRSPVTTNCSPIAHWATIRHASVPAAPVQPNCWIVLQVVARLRNFLVSLTNVWPNISSSPILATKRLYEQECDITPLEGPPLVSGSTLLPLILASFFFVARIVAKGIGLAGGWGWDDYTIITSYVSALSMFPYIILMFNGLVGPRSRYICPPYL